MKKLTCFLTGLILIALPFVSSAEDLLEKLKGKILLQVEQNGEAWYLNPGDQKRYYLGRPDDAFALMKDLGIGITNTDLEKIPMSLNLLSGKDSDGDGLPDVFENAIGTDKYNTDTDGDGYDDKTEILHGFDPRKDGGAKLPIDLNFVEKHKGKIFLQVENNGEAWYLNPADGKRYFLGRPSDAFNVMRNLGLGISDSDLQLIEAVATQEIRVTINCDEFPNKLSACEKYKCEFRHPFSGETMNREIFGLINGKCQYSEEMPNNGEMYCEYTESLRKAVAQYYNDSITSESFRTNIKGDLESYEATYFIDGKEVENPLEEAINNGQCVISGYENFTQDDSSFEGIPDICKQNPYEDISDDVIPCDAITVGYYFDGNECQYAYRGCYGVFPFETIEECQSVCEN